MTRAEGRGAQAMRHLDIIRYMCRTREWVTVVDITRDLGIHYRTAYRDLEQLEEHGVPFVRREAVAGEPGQWMLRKSAMESWLWE